MEEKLRANAELVRTVAKEQLSVDVGYDGEGVRWLDGYINRQHETASDELKDKLVTRLDHSWASASATLTAASGR